MILSPQRKGMASPLTKKFKQAVMKVTAINNMSKLLPQLSNELSVPDRKADEKSASLLLNILNSSHILMQK